MRFLKMILFLLCSLVITCSMGQDLILHDVKGTSISVSNLKGKWVIINYWAAWCDICESEVPELNNFYRHNQNKNIVLYGVNYDRLPVGELQEAIDKMHIVYPVLLEDPTEVWPLEGGDVLPVTFIIDPNGRVVKKILGGNTEKSLLAALHS